MTKNIKQTMTLAALKDIIAHDGNLTPQARSEWTSAINTVARVCGRNPSEIVADPKHLRHLIRSAAWQLAGLTPGHWSNTKSRLSAALAYAGIDVDRKRQARLSPDWAQFLDVAPKRVRQDLGGFAGFCTALEIAPADVTQETFANFLDYCNERMMRWDPRSYWLTARRAWNKQAQLNAYLHLPVIASIGTDRWRGVPWLEFPESLRAEVEALKLWLQEDEIDDLDQIEYRRSNGRRSRSRRPLRPATIKAYEYDLRAHASHLVQSGIELLSLNSLGTLVATENVKRSFQHQLHRKGLRQPDGTVRYRLFGQINAILAAARYLQVPEAHMALLGKRYNWVRPPRNAGSSARKSKRLAPFKNPEVLNKLLELPLVVIFELRTKVPLTIYDALDLQSAVALELLVHWPARRGNVAQLDLDKHIQRPPGGLQGCWTLRVEGSDVKNEEVLQRTFDEDTSAILDFYLREVRPILLGNAMCSRLFITQHGKPKSKAQLAVQVSRFVKRRLGLVWNMHLMRSIAGLIHLEDNPGHYADLQRMLAHRNISTTLNAYVGSETEQSFRQYDKGVERRRGTSGLARLAGMPAKRRKRRGNV